VTFKAFLFRGAAASAVALSAALACAAPAVAQDGTSAEASAENRTYLPAEFARFAPQSALDMLNQVPGFVIRQATVERGLGQATGNVLLNGQRISNKSDDIVAQLRRIPAANVVRIEIRDGATLGIPGLSGQVANVVSKAGGLKGQWSYRPEFRQYFTDPLLTRFDVSVSGERGPVEFTFGIENQASRSGAGGDTLIYDADGDLIDTRLDEWTGNFDQPRASARFVYDGPGDSVGNLNLSYRDFDYEYREDGFRTGPGKPDRERDVTEVEEGHDYEIGGDYQFDLWSGQLKLIGLDRYNEAHYEVDVIVDYADATPTAGERVTQDSEESERILRGEYQWKQGVADWEISAEAAFNALDSVTRLFELQPGGGFTEVAFPNGTARVEESRYETGVSYGRPLSDTLSFQLALGAEYSELSQIGGNGQTRTFWRPKGQLTAVWQADPRTTVNFRLQRKVGQLNFSDFLASVNLNNGTTNQGNPDLVPPQSWEAEVEGARSWGKWGNATLRVYGHLVDDIVDYVPIGATGESIGNLDQATRYGIEWRGTTNLDPAGIRGLRIDTRVWLQSTSVEDPLTGKKRAISGALQQFASINARWDVPETDWAFGGGLSHQRSAPVYRLTEVSRQWEIPLGGNLFVEHKNFHGLTLRASVNNLFYGESYMDRTVHDGRRTDPVSFVEIRDRTIGPIFSFEIRGKF